MINQDLSPGRKDWLLPLILLVYSNTRWPVHWRSSSLNQFVPEIVSPLPPLPAHVRHTFLIVYFFKELTSFISSLDKCHTSVFKALIGPCQKKKSEKDHGKRRKCLLYDYSMNRKLLL